MPPGAATGNSILVPKAPTSVTVHRTAPAAWQDTQNRARYLMAVQRIGLPSWIIYDTVLREWNSAMRAHIATGLEYIGQCALCGISARPTPSALSLARYDSEECSVSG